MDYSTFGETIEASQPAAAVDGATLYAAFARLHDGRHARGKRYPLALLLSLLVVAKLAGETKVSGCAEWVRLRQEMLCEQFHLSRESLPCANTYTYALSRVKAEELTEVVQQTFTRKRAEQRCGSEPSRLLADGKRAEHEQVALDGKTLRGTLKHEAPGQDAVHLLALYEVKTGLVLAQRQVGLKENEISAAPALLTVERVAHRVITADALHTQKRYCLHIRQLEGDYVLIVKDNHPTMRADLELFFEDPQADRRDWRSDTSWSKGHGRLEKRTVTTSQQLNDWFAREWIDVAQVFRIERIVTSKKGTHTEIVYGVTSLLPKRAGPAQVGRFVRGHWQIENRLHRRRDVTLGEDACQVRTGTAPQTLAALNNTVLSLMDLLQVRNVAAQQRIFAAQPQKALALLLASDF